MSKSRGRETVARTPIAIEAVGRVTGALNEAVECSLAAYGVVWTSADTAASKVRDCLRVACTEAHRLDMCAEQVLIRLKNLCLNRGDSRMLRTAGDGRSIYDHLVTARVTQYYEL